MKGGGLQNNGTRFDSRSKATILFVELKNFPKRQPEALKTSLAKEMKIEIIAAFYEYIGRISISRELVISCPFMIYILKPLKIRISLLLMPNKLGIYS